MNTKLKPTNHNVNPLLTDLYQLTMTYGYWKAGKHEEPAIFELFFRKNPFGGEYTISAGLEEVLRYLNDFHITKNQIAYLKTALSDAEPEFWQWLGKLNCSKVKVYATKEGTIVFPREPLIRVEGPLALCQLLETTLLTLTNYPSLIATNAARHRLAAGKNKTLLEFGLRRAQGPDGGISASRYAYMGGFDGTSNVQAGRLYGIPVNGTMAHAFVQSFSGLGDLQNRMLKGSDFVNIVLAVRKKLDYENTNEGELASFIAYAQAFPKKFLALVDTYNTLKSGVPNFICVALALIKLGCQPLGVRIDSGDLAYLSKEIRRIFWEVGRRISCDLTSQKIVASNDIDEAVLHALNQQRHEIDAYGIGTRLVTCWAQPALGCVYKLVEINGKPRIKLSEEAGKITIPGKKEVWRIFGQGDRPICDILIRANESRPQINQKMFIKDPFDQSKGVFVTPSKAISLLRLVWDGKIVIDLPTISEIRKHVLDQLDNMREDHLRAINPTKYKVSVSQSLYNFLNDLIKKESTVVELN